MSPEETQVKPISIDNSGNLYIRNRAARRKKPPANNWFVKSTHKIKKLRSKNVKTNKQRNRELTRIRKARQKNNS